MDIPKLFIHSPSEGHLDCFQFGQILVTLVSIHSDFSGSPVVKSSPSSAGGVGSILVVHTVKNLPPMQEAHVQYLSWEDALEREWQHTPAFLPRESHGQRRLAVYST